MAEKAAHVTMLQRSPTYIASLPEKDPIANLLRRILPARLSGPAVRWLKALTTQGFYRLSRRRPELVKRMLRAGLRRQLPKGYDIDTHFRPKYNPWDQRFCAVPDGDLFRAIREGSASVVTDQIATFTETGLCLESGTELEADVIVTATGLEMLFLGGVSLSVDAKSVDVPERLVYKGMMLEDVPNVAIAVGYTNASWTLKCDLTSEYVCRLLNHMHETGLRQCTPVNSDPSLERVPLMPLNSGYIQRAAHRFPKQGSRFPWQVHQSYLADYRALKRSRIEDDAMVFSNPEREAVAAAS
jgi:monooxygenase